MNDWFTWNDEKCTEHGIHMLTPPPFVIATERLETIEIPGRSGTVTRREGTYVHSDINLSAVCVIDTPYLADEDEMGLRIIDIAGWLRGDGKVGFWNKKGGFYKGRIANQLSLAKILRDNPHRSFSVEFQCNPYFYLDSGNNVITTTQDRVLLNPGNVPSEPLIRVTPVSGATEGSLMLGGETLVFDFTDLTCDIVVDCDAKIAYSGEAGNALNPLILRNTRVSGKWPTLDEGSNKCMLVGGIASVAITPRWRCL